MAKRERARVVVIVLLGLVSAVFEGFGLSLIIPIAQIAMASGDVHELPYVGNLIVAVFGSDPSAVHLILVAGTIFLAGLAAGVVNLILSTKLSLIFAERLRAQIFDARDLRRALWTMPVWLAKHALKAPLQILTRKPDRLTWPWLRGYVGSMAYFPLVFRPPAASSLFSQARTDDV